jgi:hypothetical protein
VSSFQDISASFFIGRAISENSQKCPVQYREALCMSRSKKLNKKKKKKEKAIEFKFMEIEIEIHTEKEKFNNVRYF